MVAIPRTPTVRILCTECLFCGAPLEIEVLGEIADAQRWLDELELEAWEYFAEEHGCEVVGLSALA